MVLDTSLLNTQHYKVCIKGKVEQSKGKNSAPDTHFGVVAIEKGAFESPLTTVANFTLFTILNDLVWLYPPGKLSPVSIDIQFSRIHFF